MKTELFNEIVDGLELNEESRRLFALFLNSLDTEEMKIFILNRLFVKHKTQDDQNSDKTQN